MGKRQARIDQLARRVGELTSELAELRQDLAVLVGLLKEPVARIRVSPAAGYRLVKVGPEGG